MEHFKSIVAFHKRTVLPGTPKTSGSRPSAKALVDQVPLNALFDTTLYFLLKGPQDSADTCQQVLSTVLTTEAVLQSADVAALQLRQMKYLEPGQQERITMAILRQLEAVASASNLPASQKLSYLLGQQGALLALLVQCVVHEDLDISEAASRVIKSAAACGTKDFVDKSEETLFGGFLNIVRSPLLTTEGKRQS